MTRSFSLQMLSRQTHESQPLTDEPDIEQEERSEYDSSSKEEEPEENFLQESHNLQLNRVFQFFVGVTSRFGLPVRFNKHLIF